MPPAWDEAAGDGGRRGFNPNSAGVRDFEIPTVVSAIQLKFFNGDCVSSRLFIPQNRLACGPRAGKVK